ncbi:hypothetical protein C8F04DRAFT_1181473 [Mycena alexandri]|uniref:Uncharacterized protein n=1 Tax=Mycena alexandri TaxID=1745969 RepID=A0AAD6X8X5_9AGAR|nr:hypothetical protein C8F04DRAFT_1181473 [Mycena alexandri]
MRGAVFGCRSKDHKANWWTPRNPQLREKNRLAMQARRAAVKAKQRQWDPAKQREATPEVDDRSSASFDPQLVSHELLYGPLHFNDGRAASTSDGEDSAFKRMDARRRVCTETSEVNLPAQSIAATRLEEQLALEALVAMVQGSHSASQDSILQRANLLSSDDEDPQPPLLPPRAVTPPIFPYTPPGEAGPSRKIRMANAAVAELNSKPLTPPTHIEARHWTRVIPFAAVGEIAAVGPLLAPKPTFAAQTAKKGKRGESIGLPKIADAERAPGPHALKSNGFPRDQRPPPAAVRVVPPSPVAPPAAIRVAPPVAVGVPPPAVCVPPPVAVRIPPPTASPREGVIVVVEVEGGEGDVGQFPDGDAGADVGGKLNGGVALLLCLALTLGLCSEAALSPSSHAAGEIRAPSTHKIMVAAKKGLLRVKSRLVFDELRRFLVTRAPRVGLTEFVASRANVEQMSNVLRKTNMTVEEMVPDLETPGHDRRFWCLPPIHKDLDEVVAIGGGYKFHLVTRGRQVGVWRNWYVNEVSSLCCIVKLTGEQDSHGIDGDGVSRRCAQRAPHAAGVCMGVAGPLPAGVHPHPVEPSRSSRSAGPSTPARRPRRSMLMPSGMPEDAPAPRRYFALWRAGLVYSTRYHAGVAFDDAVDLGEEPSLLSTEDFEVALSYAEGRLD